MFEIFQKPLVKPVPTKIQRLNFTDEYAEVTSRLGVICDHVEREPFLRFMMEQDLPLYHLPTVVKYMDRMAKIHGDGSGWLWRPMRQRDVLSHTIWGYRDDESKHRKSDFYDYRYDVGFYTLPIPLRALKRAELIETTSGIGVKFFISDYATKKDDVLPDPFLMVYACNNRYVVDFWDEPGFGIDEMLAS